MNGASQSPPNLPEENAAPAAPVISGDGPSTSRLPNIPDRRTLWRVIGASFFFLLVGLGGMWLHYVLKDQTAGGFEALGPLPPAMPTEPVAHNRARLFFTSDGALLSSEIQEIARSPSTHERASAIVQALLRGPRSSGLHSPIPRGVRLLGLYVAEDSATVDFSVELRNGLHGGTSAEMLCVYSIVNSLLLNCSDLKTVAVLIEGRPVETLLGYLDLSAPLVENLALLAGERIPGD
jgi:hypothetical protein